MFPMQTIVYLAPEVVLFDVNVESGYALSGIDNPEDTSIKDMQLIVLDEV